MLACRKDFDKGGWVGLACHKEDGRMLCTRINMILFFKRYLERKMLSREVLDEGYSRKREVTARKHCYALHCKTME